MPTAKPTIVLFLINREFLLPPSLINAVILVQAKSYSVFHGVVCILLYRVVILQTLEYIK